MTEVVQTNKPLTTAEKIFVVQVAKMMRDGFRKGSRDMGDLMKHAGINKRDIAELMPRALDEAVILLKKDIIERLKED